MILGLGFKPQILSWVAHSRILNMCSMALLGVTVQETARAAMLCVVGQTAAFLDTSHCKMPDICNSPPLLWKRHKMYPSGISNYITELTIKSCVTAVYCILKGL